MCSFHHWDVEFFEFPVILDIHPFLNLVTLEKLVICFSLTYTFWKMGIEAAGF
jgi:hypothetical protein